MEHAPEHSLSPLDPAVPTYSLSHDFPASQVISALATGASGNAPSITPMSAKEQELARQRRRNHNLRRQSKTKVRRARSSTDPSYLPRSVNQDYGLGIQYSSAPPMAAAITAQPVGASTYLEHYEDTISPAASQPVYGTEYYAYVANQWRDGCLLTNGVDILQNLASIHIRFPTECTQLPNLHSLFTLRKTFTLFPPISP